MVLAGATQEGVIEMAMRKRMRRDWPAVVAAHKSSGLSVAAFCRERGISPSLLYRWRRRHGGDGQWASSGGFVELHAVDARASGSGVALVGASGWRIELAAEFDASTLQRVLACVPRSAACLP